jgi:hypothetical protein
MRSKQRASTPDRRTAPVFLWEGQRDASLAEARSSGCALALWFKLAQAREKRHQEFAAWLENVHAKHGARFGKITSG